MTDLAAGKSLQMYKQESALVNLVMWRLCGSSAFLYMYKIHIQTLMSLLFVDW